MKLKIILLFIAILPCLSFAMVSGGAQDAAELKRIEKLSLDMKNYCPLTMDVNKNVRQMVARNLLYNETACKAKWVVEWAKDEDFPSLGLAHAIWFPAGIDKGFDESFPETWQFLRQKYKASKENGALKIPAWLDKDDIGPAPWKNAEEFKAKQETDPNLMQLSQFLQSPTVLEWQAEFAIQRGVKSGYKILAASALEKGSPKPDAKLCKHLRKLFSSDEGILTIVDYTNFKGEGIDPSEMRGDDNTRWGLKQVIEDMDRYPADPNDSSDLQERKKFAASAKQTLGYLSRAFADPKARDVRLNWLAKGWSSRIDSTYVKGGIDPAQCPMIPSNGPSPSATLSAAK